MKTQPSRFEFAHVVLSNDDRTPFEFVVQLLRLVFGRPEREAREIASTANWLGRSVCGTYPVGAATALAKEATRYAESAGYAPRIEVEPLSNEAGSDRRCSICGRHERETRYLYEGKGARICDACIVSGARQLSAGLPSQRFHYVYELLDWHFADCAKEHLVTASRLFPARMRADLQRAAASLFGGAIKTVGIHGGHDYEPLSVSALLSRDRNGKAIGPLQYQDVDVGEAEPVKCLANALWLLDKNGVAHAVLMARYQDYMQRTGVTVEVVAPSGEASVRLADHYFKALERAVHEAASYRGKVLSLEQTQMYSGMSSGILVHRLAPVARQDVILPERTIALLERNIIQFASKRTALKRVGQSTKKGLLFHGLPGTGKTHTIRYLAASLPEHTTLLVTAEQVGLLGEYFTLARLLQPSIMVIEDADLIARDRGDMDSPCEEVLLNKLLNEMDGLEQDADVFFILTTNRPEKLEPALAARPGRIDQAIEFPLPDDVGRAKLVALYGKGLEVQPNVLQDIVVRTGGVSAAFIKELMRRIAQNTIERLDDSRVSSEDVSAALEEMIFGGGKLNRALLGSATDPDDPAIVSPN